MAKVIIRVDKKTGNSKIVDVIGAGEHCQEVTRNAESKLGTAIESSRDHTCNMPQVTTEEVVTLSGNQPEE